MDRVAFTRNTLRDFVSHFTLRVADDDVVFGANQERIGDLALCGETFTAAGGAEYQPVGVFQQLAVYHDKVVGQSVDAVVQSFFPGLE